MEVNVYGKDGKKKGTIALPAVFETPFRPDVIRKAVSVAQSNRRQSYGAYPMAGKRHATESAGKGRGVSRVPRLTQGRDAALAPPNVGGRRAHPPESRRDWSEKINGRERRLAVASALASCADPEKVRGRGHRFNDGLTLPLIVDDAIAKIEKTSDAVKLFDALGIGADIVRAEAGRHERAGRGKLRGRRLRVPRSALIITADIEGTRRAFGNLSGVEIATPREMNTERLAPGGDPGRLLVITESALKEIGGGA